MDERDLVARLTALRSEHRDLDGAIARLVDVGAGAGDQIALARAKKRKLSLRDEIATIEALLIPDIIA